MWHFTTRVLKRPGEGAPVVPPKACKPLSEPLCGAESVGPPGSLWET